MEEEDEKDIDNENKKLEKKSEELKQKIQNMRAIRYKNWKATGLATTYPIHHKNIGSNSDPTPLESITLRSVPSQVWEGSSAKNKSTPCTLDLEMFGKVPENAKVNGKVNIVGSKDQITPDNFLNSITADTHELEIHRKNVAKRSYKQFPRLCYHFCTYTFIFCKCSTILCKINFKCSTILVS